MARAKQEHVNVHTGRLHASEKMVSSDFGELVPDAHHYYAWYFSASEELHHRWHNVAAILF
jgi:hypothetical protein